MGPACTKCGIVKPRTFEFFYRQAATSDGFTSWCRDCDRIKCRINAQKKREAGIKKIYNPEKSKAYTAKHKAKDIEAYREKARIIAKKRREDAGYRACAAIGRRIRACASRNFTGSLRHLAYTPQDLKQHLERQFQPGMLWENYGEEWHIDHIQPVSSFNLTGEIDSEFDACWALSNLRPLFKLENLSKHAKRTHLL